ncbi:hypothetical protein IC608_06220 [Devosia sp. PTR5]|uniref:Metallopeptidase n=1 Tax=Devosia oryzisoli TaxID=2774138 RepID=A0A927FRT4_9HYPH|nr:DUF4344 domain-containing metallopeptidase [Devosia oryzisoli]MBD8065065.1 hypothetical protein [Devosia oryzisoli]
MRRLLACLALFALASTPAAQARDLSGFSATQRAEIVRFAANNSLFVLYHELMHLLVHQLDVPVLGREEDAADNMATWTLLSRKTGGSETTLTDAAHGWILSGVAYNSTPDDEDLAAAHTLDRQRAFQIVCLMVGSDERAFRPIANQYAISHDRQDSCAWDYTLLDRSFRHTLKPLAKGAGKTNVTISYQPPGRELKSAAEAFRASGVFEEVAEELRTRYAVRKPVRFNAQRCDEANAFYDPDQLEIIFCYELMDDFIALYADELSSSQGR